MTCPFRDAKGHGVDRGLEDPRAFPVPGRAKKGMKFSTLQAEQDIADLTKEQLRRLAEAAKEARGERGLQETIQGLAGQTAVPGMAEEAVADTVRDRVFGLPDLPPFVPVVPKPAGFRGFGGFHFNATQRLFGLMGAFGQRLGGGVGGQPGGGTPGAQ